MFYYLESSMARKKLPHPKGYQFLDTANDLPVRVTVLSFAPAQMSYSLNTFS